MSVVISWAVTEKHSGSWEFRLDCEMVPSTVRLKIHEVFVRVKSGCEHKEAALSDPWSCQPVWSGPTWISECPAGEFWSPGVEINWPWLSQATPGTSAANQLSCKFPFTNWKKISSGDPKILKVLTWLDKNVCILSLPKWVWLTEKWISAVNWSW